MPVLTLDAQPVLATPEVRGLLSRYGIDFKESQGSSGELIPGLHGGTWTKQLRVDRVDWLAAQDLVRRQRRGDPLPAPPHPPTGAPTAVQTRPEGDWVCDACGEENPASFEVCWSCASTGGEDEVESMEYGTGDA